MRLFPPSIAALLIGSAAALLPASLRGESLPAVGADTLPHPLIHMAGLDVSPGTLFRTDDFFKGANAAGEPLGRTLSLHLKYAFRFGPDTRFGRNYPYAYQGVGVGYNDFFDRAEIGTPAALYVFQLSLIHISEPTRR